MTTSNRKRAAVKPVAKARKHVVKRRAKVKKAQIHYAKIFSIALFIVVFGAIAFFVFRNHWSVESRPSSSPRSPHSRAVVMAFVKATGVGKALPLAKGTSMVVVRS